MAATVNYAFALDVIDEWLVKLDQYAAIDTSYSDDKERSLDDWFTARAPLVQRLGSAFGIQPAAFTKYAKASQVPWVGTREAAIRLRGEVTQHDDRKKLFHDPPGPRLGARELHAWVWDAARHLWADGHRRQAVANTATAVEVMLRAKLGREDVSGAKLVGEAFSIEPPAMGRPRLRFPELLDESSERWRSAHLGALHLSQGCFEAIRNWAAHTLEEENEQVALEYLASLSVFARWVDRAEVRTS